MVNLSIETQCHVMQINVKGINISVITAHNSMTRIMAAIDSTISAWHLTTQQLIAHDTASRQYE